MRSPMPWVVSPVHFLRQTREREREGKLITEALLSLLHGPYSPFQSTRNPFLHTTYIPPFPTKPKSLPFAAATTSSPLVLLLPMARSAIVLSPLPMEDPSLLAADCLVICTCCPCLVLQVLVLLVRLPCRLARRSKKLVLKKLRKRRRRKGSREVARAGVVIVGDGPLGVQMAVADALLLSNHGYAIVEAERVLQQLYERGVLGFGSFWRSGADGGESTARLPCHAEVADRLVLRSCSNVHGVEVRYV